MSVRVMMFDVDGGPDSPFRGAFMDFRWADLGIDPRDLDRVFFNVPFNQVLAGEADLFDQLDSVLPKISSVSSRELVNYWFTHDAALDVLLLAELDEARRRGLTLHLVTVQEHHRARFLWDSLGLRDHFDAMHYAANVGALKSQPEFYSVVESRTGLLPVEHCLIDDQEDNVKAAQDAGWQAFLRTPGSRFSEVLQRTGR